MIERGGISEQTAVPTGQTAAEHPENGQVALEQRVRRLEDAVATLQDTHPLEERIVERVSRRLNRTTSHALQESGGVFSASRQLLPAALDLIRNKADEAQRRSADSSGPLGRAWLLFDAYAEVRTIVRMFLDRRYRPTWLARVVPLTLLILILTSWIWLPVPSILGTTILTILDKTADLALAFLAFKILSREARRYRELVTDLPAPARP
jgi:hypothetical protein